ncbi:hypothetical protein G6F56_003279 [Rhizopus delemar]|nr:hypothetical protein G6F56_003279 [Rhizopus delemar]
MFENGQGDIVDENGNEAMDWEEEVNPHNTETLSNFTQYSEKTINASTTPKNKYADYSDSQKTLFIYYLQLNLLSAVADARKAAINVRTGFMLKDTVIGKFISTEYNLSTKAITRHPVARNQSAKIK